MQLDRNTNRGGRGKYALVNMRQLIPLIDATEVPANQHNEALVNAFDLLVANGIITLGTESPGDQFFVMKYKDKFTAPALLEYAISVVREAHRMKDASLQEYAVQMLAEANAAKKLGDRIPD